MSSSWEGAYRGKRCLCGFRQRGGELVQDIIERLQRIEEAQAFAERTVDQLSSEVIRAFEELVALQKRIDRLEGRVSDVEKQDEDPTTAPGQADTTEE